MEEQLLRDWSQSEHGGIEVVGLVIENENGHWKISHMHASFPDIRNPDKGSFPVNN